MLDKKMTYSLQKQEEDTGLDTKKTETALQLALLALLGSSGVLSENIQSEAANQIMLEM